jgi:hypothetical protein
VDSGWEDNMKDWMVRKKRVVISCNCKTRQEVRLASVMPAEEVNAVEIVVTHVWRKSRN